MVAKCGKIDGTEALAGRCCVQAFWNGGFMLHTGDRVVHPLHGAGVIEGVVERMIDDEPVQYYVLRPAFGDTELFLPVNGCEKLGIRPVCSRAQAERFLAELDSVVCGESKGWNQRYRENMQHIRSGELREVAQVIKSLAARECRRGLSTGEKKMLTQAMQILESELSFALECPAGEIAAQLREHLCR